MIDLKEFLHMHPQLYENDSLCEKKNNIKEEGKIVKIKKISNKNTNNLSTDLKYVYFGIDKFHSSFHYIQIQLLGNITLRLKN